jgi:ferritin-like metal-binding protein YciE
VKACTVDWNAVVVQHGEPRSFGPRTTEDLTMALATMHDLMLAELRELYSAETQQLMALPRMATSAATPALRRAFVHLLDETHDHVARLSDVFNLLDESPLGLKSMGMAGLIVESYSMIDRQGEETVRDAGLIAVARRIEHQEIAAYRTSLAFATLLAFSDVATLLEITLDEERAADHLLAELAEHDVNANAPAFEYVVREHTVEWAAPRRHSTAMSGR